MRRRTALLSAATVVAALGLSGCSSHRPAAESSAPESSTTTVQQPAATPAADLPAPEALTEVLYRLADPGIPGTDKLNLVAGATAADAATLDKFAKALLDNGYTPPSFDATDLAWSDANPADVVATVTVNKPEPDGGFSIPMEFKPHQGGWQLSRETYDMLLNLGKTSAPTSPGPPG
ncbi:hypothetical protein [Mycobacterium talmoniae]|uniref:Low molecular weight antigen MTB12-like C-terminal domain-containing protein n=1 Tax=Mycobacterium talmoniae TaxID=1858794 RepID=A0A1S1NLR6_9MYCO|nr:MULTISPECIES: hypothetical protein [Mycobacterium]OHV04148.1 hypothetical protein BKN37_11400 [Mycobacterium talmoniae]TDH56925.1 hypothetical protein E2F47_04715 [Mycobacterium eburneum]